MTFVSIFACVLAFGALTLVAVLWLTCLRRQLEQDAWRSTTTSNTRQLAAKLVSVESTLKQLKATAPAGLAAQVAELSDAVARLAKTQQRFAGKYYAEGKQPVQTNSVEDLDPELAAELALQSAPPVAPGRS